MSAKTLFLAYPSFPDQVGITIEESAKSYRGISPINIQTWKQLDVPGRFIVEGIIERIDAKSTKSN